MSTAYAQELNCMRYGSINVDTNERIAYTYEESQKMPSVILNTGKKYVYLTTPSGKKFKHDLYKIANNLEYYHSEISISNIRHNLSKKEVWFLDLNVKGQMLSTILICK